MKAYHLFREGDASFVYHLASGRFIRVTPAAYDLLELRETTTAEEAGKAFLARHPGETGVLNDVAAQHLSAIQRLSCNRVVLTSFV